MRLSRWFYFSPHSRRSTFQRGAPCASTQWWPCVTNEQSMPKPGDAMFAFEFVFVAAGLWFSRAVFAVVVEFAFVWLLFGFCRFSLRVQAAAVACGVCRRFSVGVFAVGSCR